MQTMNGIRKLIMRSVGRSIWISLIVAGSLFLAANSSGQSNHDSASSASRLITSFEPLGQGPKGGHNVFSRAWAVSADGNIVVGTFLVKKGFFLETHAFRWTKETRFQDLGTLNPPFVESEAYAVSDDGSKVVGWSRGVSGFQRPYLWTATRGMRELKVPGSDAKATGISSDGQIIVGSFFVDKEGSWHAFQWNGGKFTDLGFLRTGSDSKAHAACGLGAAAVGSTVNSRGVQTAFRWRNQQMHNLGGVGTNNLSYAEACSDDGKVVVGTSMDDQGNLLATRWSLGEILSLGTLGGAMSESHATSADGSIVVGGAGLPFVDGISQFSGFRWSSTTGIEQLSRMLENQGVTNVQFCHQIPCAPGTWFIDLLFGTSSDGTVIVGTTWSPNLPFPNNVEAFRAVVPNR